MWIHPAFKKSRRVSLDIIWWVNVDIQAHDQSRVSCLELARSWSSPFAAVPKGHVAARDVSFGYVVWNWCRGFAVFISSGHSAAFASIIHEGPERVAS